MAILRIAIFTMVSSVLPSVECDFKDVADELPKAKAFLDEWF